jgi:ribosomal protein L6P/L9E
VILALKGIDRITLGYKERLKLLGVGFRGEVKLDNKGYSILSLRVGKPEVENFIIPKDVTVNVENDSIEF